MADLADRESRYLGTLRRAARQFREQFGLIGIVFHQRAVSAHDVFPPLANGIADGEETGLILPHRRFVAAEGFAHDLAGILMPAGAYLPVDEIAEAGRQAKVAAGHG